MRFFGEPAGTKRWRIAPAPRRFVEFRALNLTDLVWPVQGPFDVIFCRNVLMYLEACHRYAVLERMASLLAPDGVLMLDPAEHLGQAAHLFPHGTKGIYRPRSLPRLSRPAPISGALV
jgi:chemotaxis protein methyltransferase CheR